MPRSRPSSPLSPRRRPILAAALVTLIGIIIFGAVTAMSGTGKGMLAGTLSRALSTPERQISIGSIEGLLSSQANIRGIEVSDRQGVWLKANELRITWQRLALLRLRLEIDRIDLDRIEVLRKPLTTKETKASAGPWQMPQLPLPVGVKEFVIESADLAAPVLGTSARFTANGSAHLGPASRGAGFALNLKRLDRQAMLKAYVSYLPETGALITQVDLEEAEGGLIAELADLPGRPPVKFDLDGKGTTNDFHAKLAFDAGDELGANGEATLTRDGPDHKLSLALAAEASPLMPKAIAPIFAGKTELTGTVFFKNDGSIETPGLALVAEAARLDAEGSLDAKRQADIKLTGTNIPNTDKGTKVEGAQIERFALDATARGPLDALAINGTLNLEKARLPTISVGSVSADFAAAPAEPSTQEAAPMGLSANVAVKDLALADAALNAAIGSELNLKMRGKGALTAAQIEELLVETPSLSASFTGKASASDLAGRLEAQIPDLARFAPIARMKLAGTAKLGADLEGAPADQKFAATIDAEASRFAIGIQALNGLIGGKLGLTGRVAYAGERRLEFDDLRLTGANGSALVNGTATQEAVDVTALVSVPSLEKADKRLTGQGEIEAKITGTLEHPDATATLSIRDATMLGRSVPHLEMAADATDLIDALKAHVSLDAEIDRKPASGTMTIERPKSGEISLDELDATIGSVAMKGAVSLDTKSLAAGQLSVKAENLDDLSPLLLQKLSGLLDADVTLARTQERQDIAIKADGKKIEAFGVGIRQFATDLSIHDLYERPVISGKASADEARIGTETISRIRLDAQESEGASDITLTALAREINLDAKMRAIASDPFRIELSKLDAKRGRTHIGLAGPATIIVKDGGADIQGLALKANGGRLTLDGQAGSKLDLRATARALPLSIADLVMPKLGLGGTLEGEVSVTGTPSAPTGPYRLRVTNFAMPQTKTAGLPPIEMTANGRLDGTKAAIDATIKASQAGNFQISGTMPLASDGALDLAVKGRLDAAIANRTIAAAGRRVTGSVSVDGRVTGTLAKPQASGAVVLANGSFQDAVLGMRFTAIQARLVALGDKVTIESASATARNGRQITAQGDIRLDPAAGFPGTLTIRGQDAEMVRSAIATAVTDLDLRVSGPLARYPEIGGTIGIQRLNITIPDNLSGPGQPLAGTRHIDPTPTAARRLAIEAESEKSSSGQPPFNAALNLTLTVPGQIHITGRGLDAVLGGSLQLRGTLAEPQPVGAFNLVRGSLRVVTSQLDITRAKLTFAGNLTPQLDFLASTQAGGASINVAVTGPANDPQFTFSSSPDLAQDEILSRLLFGQGSGQLTPTQALTLAQAAAIYSGGTTALEGLRRSLGLGDASRSNNPLTNWLGNRVSVGVRTGATPAQTGVGVDISIWKKLKARGTLDAKGGATVGAGAEFEW
jgi:translocation and assembly module TamB